MCADVISFRIAAFVALILAGQFAPAQSQPKKPAGERDVQQELVRTETGFFDAWKANDQAYFRNHIPENGVFWGEDGTLSRDQQLRVQEMSSRVCTIDGYSLSDFGLLPLASGAYLLTYKAARYASCVGEKLPVHINGSSVYIFKEGRWQAVYRAQIDLKDQN
jgi:hypothetical protein